MNRKVPPHDASAEEYVLSSMMFDAGAAIEALTLLAPEEFYRPDHAEIFRAMGNLYGLEIPIDVVSIASELEKSGVLEQIGGHECVVNLASSYYTSANIRHHALEIKRHAESRRILKALAELQNKPDVSVDDVMTLAQAVHDNQYIHEFANVAAKSVDEFKQNLRVKKPRILTGFKTIDNITGGFRIPSVVTIGAYPSVGKTAFAINIADKVLQTSPIVFISLEMSCDAIYERLASSKFKIDYGMMNQQRLTEKQYQAIEMLADSIKRHKFNVFEYVYYIEQQARIIASLKPKLVIVDYTQKVRTHKKIENRRLEIEYISGAYKEISKQNDCVVLLLSQLSRPDKSVNPKKHRPTMASLKETGALEADGDYVGILHRKYVLAKDDPELRPEDATILFDKNKYGNVGEVELHFDGKYQLFYETDTSSRMAHDKQIGHYGNVSSITPEDDMPF